MQISNFLQKCIGLALVSGTILFGSAALISTINPAKADNPTTVNNSGKYQMSTVGFMFNSKPVYNVLVWDTETGKSKIYGFNSTTFKMVQEGYQLPASPLY
jgi:hypothetical protein